MAIWTMTSFELIFYYYAVKVVSNPTSSMFSFTIFTKFEIATHDVIVYRCYPTSTRRLLPCIGIWKRKKEKKLSQNCKHVAV